MVLVNGGPVGDFEALIRFLLVTGTMAIERYKSVLREWGLADRTLPMGISLDLQPLVDAGPAVEMATECDNRFRHKVQADVTVEAPIRRR